MENRHTVYQEVGKSIVTPMEIVQCIFLSLIEEKTLPDKLKK
jgi:hypothetical protein